MKVGRPQPAHVGHGGKLGARAQPG